MEVHNWHNLQNNKLSTHNKIRFTINTLDRYTILKPSKFTVGFLKKVNVYFKILVTGGPSAAVTSTLV